jgi:hypothetical protein
MVYMIKRWNIRKIRQYEEDAQKGLISHSTFDILSLIMKVQQYIEVEKSDTLL